MDRRQGSGDDLTITSSHGRMKSDLKTKWPNKNMRQRKDDSYEVELTTTSYIKLGEQTPQVTWFDGLKAIPQDTCYITDSNPCRSNCIQHG